MLVRERYVGLWTCVFVCVQLLSGCGTQSSGPPEPPGPKGTAKGTIRFKDKLITEGTIMLDSGKGSVAMSPISPDGTFELKGSNGAAFPAGKYKVGVVPADVPPVPNATTMPERPTIPGVPVKFYSPGSSGVTITINEGDQKLDIVLE